MFDIVLKHAPKYLGASSIASIVALVMLKYYTEIFSPAEFGILALYLIMFKYVMTLCSLNMDSSATRLYFDYKDTKRDEYLSTIFWFITGISIIVILLGLLFIDPVSNWIAPNSKIIYVVTLLAGIGAVYVSFLTRVLYNEQKSNSVFKHSIFQIFINHTSSVLFISVFNLGIFGRMSGQGLGYFLNIFTLIREFSKENLFKLKLQFNKKMANETFMLALPLMITSLQTVVFVYIDRIFIKHYMGDSSVGVYTLGFILGQGLSMVYEAISQAILPKMYNDMKADYEKAKAELEHFSYRYYLSLIVITVIISALSPVLVSLFSNDNYAEAATVMPFVMAGFMMGGFYKIPSLVLGFHKIVWFYPFLAFFAFGTNVLLNWSLIPIYGLVGAAFASFAGFFLNSLIIFLVSMRYFNNRLSWYIAFIYCMSFIVIMIMFLRFT
jgi:O-antigen/teichoic acid export membrane protein